MEAAVQAVAGLAPLMPHQEEGVLFLDRTGGRGLLADEPGLGKTRTTLEYLRRNKIRAVVVTTKSFLYGWKAEAEKWWPEARVSVCGKAKDAFSNSDDLVVITYDVLWRMATTCHVTSPCVVFDESHKLANGDAKRSKAARDLVKGKKHVICLTGTPQPAGQPRQLWHQLLLVFPRFMVWKAFAARYCNPTQVWASWAGRYVWDYSGESNSDELRALMAPRFLRRTKSILNLPELTAGDVAIPVKLERKRTEEWASYSSRLAEAKAPHTIRLVADVLERGGKVIVFTSYKAVRDLVWAGFEGQAVGITAGMPPAVRTLEVSKFQKDEKIRVFVATTQIASEAITLTAASTVIFNDLPFTPGAVDQAQSRAHRKGAANPVHVYCVLSNTRFDRVVREVLSTRRTVTEKLLDERVGGGK